MEDKNYRDDFELFLKENADEFRMVPSRRVWYSLYNNMHPDRRWPSMAVCLLILTAVLYIGIENNNSLSNAAQKNAAENFTSNLNNNLSDKNTTFLPPFLDNKNESRKQNTTTTITLNNIPAIVEPINTFDAIETPISIPQDAALASSTIINIENNRSNFLARDNNNVASNENGLPNKFSTDNKLNIVGSNSFAEERKTGKSENSSLVIIAANNSNNNNQHDSLVIENIVAKNSKNDSDKELKNSLSDIEKSWKEDYAFRNKPAINRLKQNGSMSYYITPSIGYRTFGKRDYVKRTSASTASFNNFSGTTALSGDRKLDDEAALNLEIGAAFQYSVSKNVRIKTGIQGNYTNYMSNVTSLGHPTQIALDVSNSSPVYAASNYSSTSGSSKLNKTTLQVSVPIGADVKMTNHDKVNWYVGATLQPTYIIKGSGYVLSSDGGNYASEPSLLRKLNLNSSIESFISFKPSPGVTMMVGPQLRYQLFSSFKNQYNYSEKLYNLGIKLGISTSF